MPVTNRIISLQWETPTKILEANKKRLYVRFHVKGEYFFLGGANLTRFNGIQCNWQGLQSLRTPEAQYEYWAIGQCQVNVMEVTED